VWAMVVPDEGLQRFARALRVYHDAVAGFAPPAGTPWATGAGPPGENEVMCHNDIGPWNVVWRSESPVAFIDWDYAAPASAIDDVAYALWWATPFASDEECVTWRRFAHPPHRPDRIEVFAAAYGLTSVDGLVDAVINRQRKFRATVVQHAERGIAGAVAEVADGYLDTVDSWIAWSESNRHLVEPR
jgi:thiamine kinase-like enzyme